MAHTSDVHAVEAGVINCATYTGGIRADLEIDAIGETLCRPGQFVWLGLYEPEEALLRRVQQKFHLHDLAVEDAYSSRTRIRRTSGRSSSSTRSRCSSCCAPRSAEATRRTSSSAKRTSSSAGTT
jgi:hypothetical protein